MATLSLCLIAKNEEHNLPTLFDSIEGCFDEIILVDTGSTDNTVALAKERGAKVYHFDWVSDFAAARNFSFSKATSDYIGWMDLDDKLEGRENFIKWKNTVMPLSNYWLATYHYASDAAGKPVCSFARERIVKRAAKFQWKYFVHEGIVPDGTEPVSSAYATSWAIVHRRTQADLAADKGRNMRIFEANLDNLDSRMLYYYGKELFENGKPLEAYSKLMEAMQKPDLDHHDRILAIQYAATAATQLKQFPQCIDLAIRGLQIAPTRAEFFVLIGDAYCAQEKIAESVPYYTAATHCRINGDKGRFAPPIFSAEFAYTHWPRMQLGRAFFQLGDLGKAKAYFAEALQIGHHEEVVQLQAELAKVEERGFIPSPGEGKDTTDIVITCLGGLYEWDEDVYKTYGCGGSETAAIEMARHLSEQTGRQVIIYNDRKTVKDFGLVSYRPISEAWQYFREYIPAVHIAWRHAEKLTNAPTWLWVHDLFAQNIERADWAKVFALSQFHKDYLSNLFGVPEERITLTSNGIEPKRWDSADYSRKKNIVIFPSSPDRGLDNALRAMDLVVKEVPDVEFRAFYGFENLTKLKRFDVVNHLQQMLNERPWATMKGNITQADLTQEMLRAKVWLYPTNFLETSCIVAMESAISRVYPVVRKFGALPYTLEGVPADIIDRDCVSPGDIAYYAERTIAALKEEKWQTMRVVPEDYSWSKVAASWVQLMGLK